MIDEVVTISKFKATCLAVLDKVKRTGRPVLVTIGTSMRIGGNTGTPF